MNIALVIAVAAISAAPAPARPANPKEADVLFKQGRALLAENKPADACPLFERSHLLDPALGTLLNLADCYELTQKFVQAYLSFTEAAAWATRTREANRSEIARARAAGLKTRLSWVALSITAPVPGLSISVNDLVVKQGTAPQSVPVEVGTLKIVAMAPGRDSWTTTVTVGARQTVAVAVPVLVVTSELKKPDVKDLDTPPVSSPVVTPAARPVVKRPVAPPSRTGELALIAGGAAVIATGAVGLAWTFTIYDRLQKQQPGQPNFGAPTVTRGDLSTLRWLYPASWAAVGVGAVAAGAGTFFYLRGGSTSFAVLPTQSGVAFAASGTF